MSKDNIIRAWRDPEYRSSLNSQEHALLPANPAGTIDDGKLAEVAGCQRPTSWFLECHTYTVGCIVSWLLPVC